MSGYGIVAFKNRVKAALNPVAGVTCYVYAPNVWKPGDCWPQWSGAGQPESGPYAQSFTHAYRLIVVLPADRDAADTWVDEHLDDLVAALADVISVTEIAPAKLPAEGSQAAFNGLAIIGEVE